MKRSILSLVLVIALVLTTFSGAFAFAGAETAKNVYRNDADYLIQKISNPTTYSGEADGLVPGGDRENSYAWSMQEMQDLISLPQKRKTNQQKRSLAAPFLFFI